MADKTLYTIIQIRRGNTAYWVQHKDYVPESGEPCLDLDKGTVKYGDGVTTYENLKESGSSASHYEGVRQGTESDNDVITRVLSADSITARKDDIFVVKALIAEDKYSYTAYVYNGSVWAAMDGNYSAKNVYFDEDLVTTAAVGNITLKNGQATIPAEGKNLKQVFNAMFVTEKNPTTTQPGVNITFAAAGAYEVGASVTPAYTASLNGGSYTYGPATGVTATSWEITDTASHSSSAASGSFEAVIVADDTNYTITAKANHTEGAVPNTNLGNPYTAGKIASGSKSKTSSAITGYRNSFYGTVEDKSDAVSSAIIRGLPGKSGRKLTNGATFNVTIPINAQRVIIAYPATLRDVSSIADVNGMGAEIKSGFVRTTVDVEGANGAAAISYKVYTLDFANPNDTANTFAVTI